MFVIASPIPAFDLFVGWGSARVVNGGWGFCANVLPYRTIVDFLFLRVMFGFLHFLWRVRFWLRMNAGGVLNTCKSNGILKLAWGESGERVSNA